jgi:hypothetical protein
MNEPSESDALLAEFQRERSVRRTVQVLQFKRSRIREDLLQLVKHLSVLVPLTRGVSASGDSQSDLLIEAIGRLDDDSFSQLLLQIIEEAKSKS